MNQLAATKNRREFGGGLEKFSGNPIDLTTLLAYYKSFAIHAIQRLESRRCNCACTFASDQAWEQVVAFSGYGFNQGHATAYADTGWRI